ncbi:Glycosyl hydrolases family 16 protein [Trichomonas vaginalis G3]|uniref:Glycosyl hydrolases family 16 protein n=1 Tax=Trichomonas vaginalis (strain ATCC PRA-98 / G3) TaxID=412133 RepID=A2FTG9_TRIV3|nr:glycosyl hydrolase [Trichomonas vaginalis G3]EAX91787.1 Glycosyl hydrolases family 16 protein [Trichomonas vaginalis G3]KAI5549032.1 xyloglucan endotransglucosylase/hydrolase protein 8-related family [Trichomonas vaginalis G3]|eukprot:XP_001304717.1 glycosyl hydrolase [Trichomonas vaginalis G3]
MLLCFYGLVSAATIVDNSVNHFTFQSREVCLRNFYWYHGVVEFNVNENDNDITALKLTWNSSAGAGTTPAVNMQTQNRYRYGHFETKMRTPDTSSDPTTGVVSSFFTYWKPKAQDENHDGVEDVAEIDFEFLAGNPHQIHLTVHVGNNWPYLSKIYRVVDLQKGLVTRTEDIFKNATHEYTKDIRERSFPKTIPKIESYSSVDYHVYGFDYFPNRVEFWVKINSQKILLWNVTEKIPFLPMHMFANLWWTNDWYPDYKSNIVTKPTIPIHAWYKYFQYVPLSVEEKKQFEPKVETPVLERTPEPTVTNESPSESHSTSFNNSEESQNGNTPTQNPKQSNWKNTLLYGILAVVLTAFIAAVIYAVYYFKTAHDDSDDSKESLV